uniref:L antigen family member 3 n=1 Tax=Rousettus aegyptiacus TaxID=9407 RepID=A0A7J8EKE7_ROUAE|nr:hypothetical protein HJG63_012590 [Rousettus aegyptiacus]
MEAGGRGGGRKAKGPGGPGNSGGPDGREGREGPGGDGAREAGAAAAGSPQAAQAPPAPGQGASEVGVRAGPAAGGPGRQMLQFFLTVPFPTWIEAEMAHRSMAPRVQLQGAVRKEITVSGNSLAIRLSTEDVEQLQISVTACLDQLSLLFRIMQRFVPPFFPKPKPGKGG